MKRWPFFRDMTLFACGLAGAAHEALGVAVVRPELIVLFAAMMGLPAFLGGVEAKKGPAQTEQQRIDTIVQERLDAEAVVDARVKAALDREHKA